MSLSRSPAPLLATLYSLKGENRDRNNDNRLFDDQNNNRGGYNVGNLYYYEGSLLPIELTAQHSCGNANTRCELVLQYACDDLIRDGTDEGTIPTNNANCYNNKCDTDVRYGRHESQEYYRYCVHRERNKGLFTGTQNLNNRNTAQHTRQNAAGTRYGYECPEERDYYPYWTPTPWRDIAILTNDPTRCDAYKAESQNVKSRFYCQVPEVYWTLFPNPGQRIIPITQEACEAMKMVDPTTEQEVAAKWTEAPAFGLPAPVCRQNLFTRDNHHGNTIGGQMISFNWTLPSTVHERCVMRLRYNISSSDYDGWESPTSIQTSAVDASMSGPIKGGGQANVPLWERFGLTEQEGRGRGYVVQNNPDVDLFGTLLTGDAANKLKLQLNINTAQFSRTFEDRSHRFAIRSREGKYPADAVIYNVNVRGKRGNIVQTYPATEYDYVPNRLHAKQGDYVHFQWTGSDSNPANNDGQGRQRTDRSNIVGLNPRPYNPVLTQLTKVGDLGTNYPKMLSQGLNFLGWSNDSLTQLATLSSPGGQFGGDMDELNDAGTYFDLAPQMVGRVGIFNYMCTRNNNFSNRSQKGALLVSQSRVLSEVVGWNGGVLAVSDKTQLSIPKGAFSSAQQLSLTVSPSFTLRSEDGESVSDLASDIVVVSGTGNFPSPVKLRIAHSASPLAATRIYRADSLKGPWRSLFTTVSSSTAEADITQPGVYAVRAPLKVGAIIGIVLGGIIFIGAGIFLIWYCKKKADAATIASYENVNTAV